MKNRIDKFDPSFKTLALSRLSADPDLLWNILQLTIERIYDTLTDGENSYRPNPDCLITDLESAIELVRVIDGLPWLNYGMECMEHEQSAKAK